MDDPLDPHAAAPIARAPTTTAGATRWITVRHVRVVRFICLILLGDICMVVRKSRLRGLLDHQTPGSNLQRTRLVYVANSVFVASTRSSTTALPALHPVTNSITSALRTEMLCSR